MSVDVKVGGELIVVPGRLVRDIVDALISGRMEIIQSRASLAEQVQRDTPSRSGELGYVDFDSIEDGRPTIVGDFYRNTFFGLKLTGRWDEFIRKINSTDYN